MRKKIIILVILIIIAAGGYEIYKAGVFQKIKNKIQPGKQKQEIVVPKIEPEKFIDLIDRTAYGGDSYYKVSVSDQVWDLGSSGYLTLKSDPICNIRIGAGGHGAEGLNVVTKDLKYNFGAAKELVFYLNQDGPPEFTIVKFPMADAFPGTSLEGIEYIFEIYPPADQHFKSVDEYLACREAVDKVLDTFMVPNASNNILISKPKIGDEVSKKIDVSGYARVFEGQFNIRLKTVSGDTLVETTVTARMKELGLFSPFKTSFEFSNPEEKEMILETFDYSAKDGSKIDMVKIPLKYK